MPADYELLTADNAVGYVAGDPGLSKVIDTSSAVDVREVGDGNLNLVFIVQDAARRGLVLKQALPASVDPAAGIALIIGVDRILDMCRTAVNVTGDLTAATFVARLLNRHRWIAYVGLAIILYVALDMMWRGAWEIQSVAAG